MTDEMILLFVQNIEQSKFSNIEFQKFNYAVMQYFVVFCEFVMMTFKFINRF